MSYDSDYWYVRDAGNVAGPFTRAQVMDRWGRGELEWYHEVSQDQLIWVSVSTLRSSDSDADEPGPAKGPAIRPGRRWRWVGTAVLFIGVLSGLVWVIQGAGAGDPETAAAILRVLGEDDRISKETFGSLGTNESPSVYANAIAIYLARVRGVNMADCPADFRVAFKRHLDCWGDLRTAIKAFPEDALQGFAIGFMNAYFFSEKDGGLTRMAANIRQEALNVRDSFREVERIAATYGAALP